MLAKRQNSYEADFAKSSNPQNIASTDARVERTPVRGTEALAPITEPVGRVREKVISVNFANLAKSPPKTPWPDYEEFFPTTEVEATEPIATLTPALVNRRCYWLKYWPSNQVFRIKEVNPENNTVYLNLIYRWVNATNIKLLKARTPTRPPKDIELPDLTESLEEEELDF
ncbi:MAG TPA: hypothetical protein DDZ80_08985 [Cyanobacteria bacterium UBA8803]|nr:hypothetical protein [Cyanobacteria bacterium UBA9273]HBL58632.1 hypothetical protein [Cyanobacteria bacterium UBA8803]